MPTPYPIKTPAEYAPTVALGYSDAGMLKLVEAGAPLPVSVVSGGDAAVQVPPALTGIATGNAQAGPFTPARNLPIVLTLTGTWTGKVRLLRSIDGGATRLPLTAAGLDWASFEGNACEPVWAENEAGATLYLDIALTSGAVTYRVAQ